jgi:hypothetical protein
MPEAVVEQAQPHLYIPLVPVYKAMVVTATSGSTAAIMVVGAVVALTSTSPPPALLLVGWETAAESAAITAVEQATAMSMPGVAVVVQPIQPVVLLQAQADQVWLSSDT